MADLLRMLEEQAEWLRAAGLSDEEIGLVLARRLGGVIGSEPVRVPPEGVERLGTAGRVAADLVDVPGDLAAQDKAIDRSRSGAGSGGDGPSPPSGRCRPDG